VGCYAAALKKLREAKQTIDGRSQSEMARRAQFTWGALLKIVSHTWRSLATLRFRSFIGEGVGDWTWEIFGYNCFSTNGSNQIIQDDGQRKPNNVYKKLELLEESSTRARESA